MKRRSLVLAGAGLLAMPQLGVAQVAWPGRGTVRIVSASPPGTPQDLYARSIAEHCTRMHGGVFVVENRTGAAGTIGVAAVANAPPDGYTFSFNSNTSQTISPQVMRNVGFDPVRSLDPVVLVYKYGMYLMINPQIPAQTTQEFVVWARAQSGRVNIASVGLASGGHLMGERVRLLGGFRAEPIHYRGSPPALLAVAQGECHYIVDNLGASEPLRKEGRLRGLALTGRRRNPGAPEIPTLAEEGLPGFDQEIWFGMSVPAGTPREPILKMNAAVNDWLKGEAVQKRMIGFMHEAMGGSPEDFASFAAWDSRIWTEVIRETGVRAE